MILTYMCEEEDTCMSYEEERTCIHLKDTARILLLTHELSFTAVVSFIFFPPPHLLL